ncbi:MAG: glycosyltransferase, partial [Cypionkella sp.]
MSGAPGARPRILHLHSSFARGGKERRAVRLMNAFGPGIDHAIVSGVADETGAAAEIARAIKVDWPAAFPPLQGRPTLGRLKRLAEAMRGYDLVLTYNWGAIDAVMAATLFGEAFGLPPLIHHEDGFNDDERRGLKRSRNWYRRIALGRARGLVVPSETLEEIALTAWAQPIGRVIRIANGIDTRAFEAQPAPDALPGVIKHSGELWIGTLAGLRPVKNLAALVRACAPLPEYCQLVIVGEGPERAAIEAEAARLGIADRLLMPGFLKNPARYVGLFDIFALSSDSEQQPISVMEAMAAGLPVAAPMVGDVAHMVAPDNAILLAEPGSEAGLI